MRNSIILGLLVLISSCKKDNYEDPVYPQTSTGQAFVIKNSFADNFYNDGKKDSILNFVSNTNDTSFYYFYNVTYDFHLDFLIIEDFKPKPLLISPVLEYIHDRNYLMGDGPTIPDSSKWAVDTLIFDQNAHQPASYTNLILMDCERDKNAMYFSSFGFFLEQYLDSQNNPTRTILGGFYNNANNTLDIVPNTKAITPRVYEKTIDASKNPTDLFDYIPANELLNQIELGINELTASPQTGSLNLTIITYTLFDTFNLNYTLLNDIKTKLTSEEITLNIISLLPVNFAMPLVFCSGGFIQNDLYYIDKLQFYAYPNQFEELVEKGKFPSSTTIQNMEKLINGQEKNDFNRYTVRCAYGYPNNVPEDTIKKILRKQQIYIKWKKNNNGSMPFEFELKPIIN
ncbi:MAG: hypothetical protein AB8B72_03375 [Crocinitomicaceae bacterium]